MEKSSLGRIVCALLHRINRELCGNIPVSAFRHVARWNEVEARIEMHLEATRDVAFSVAGQHFAIPKAECRPVPTAP
jgi:uncharacterized SAM-dependent methyltransferase